MRRRKVKRRKEERKGRKRKKEGRNEKKIIEGKKKDSTLLKYDLALHIRKKILENMTFEILHSFIYLSTIQNKKFN